MQITPLVEKAFSYIEGNKETFALGKSFSDESRYACIVAYFVSQVTMWMRSPDHQISRDTLEEIAYFVENLDGIEELSGMGIHSPNKDQLAEAEIIARTVHFLSNMGCNDVADRILKNISGESFVFVMIELIDLHGSH